ncbi:MAG: glutamate-5-semialdehyde dehydrogenase, partial [Candidatus Omnitrophota bacterium]|nr:glutamate-5-semialdehyde dehydrogenase [Candidatus Omnitrophota bacterium]
GKMRVPIGVIGIIYESRPDVTSDCAGLCLKSGNSVILKGGSEALRSNKAIFKCLRNAISKTAVPEEAIVFMASKNRSAVTELLRLNDYVDLIIPRGGEGLIREVAEMSRIPVIKHYKGICHVYVDENADLNMAHRIAINAKVQRPGVCNAMETLLVHKDAAVRFLPVIAGELRNAGVEIRGCEKTRKILKGIKRAGELDWRTEYLDLILSVKVVSNIDEAIGHIAVYGSNHSDAIVTKSYDAAMKFLRSVDSACVYLNASTRFTDGYEFGMGAEIGISTDKLHARGPMGLEELTTYKYVILGKGQIRG